MSQEEPPLKAKQKPVAYLVMEREYFYTDEVMAPVFEETVLAEPVCSLPRRIFFDPEQALSYALQESWQVFVTRPLGDWGLGLDMVTSLPPRTFYQNLKSVLGDNFTLPADLDDPDYDIWQEVWFEDHLDKPLQEKVLSWCDRVVLFEVVPARIDDLDRLIQAAQKLSGEVRTVVFDDTRQGAVYQYLISEEELSEITRMFGVRFEPNLEYL